MKDTCDLCVLSLQILWIHNYSKIKKNYFDPIILLKKILQETTDAHIYL